MKLNSLSSRLFGFFLLFVMVLPARAEPHSSLSIGLFPNLSTRLLLETYQPMREYLEQKLGRPVTFYTGSDFSNFVGRTQNGEFDLVITAPHLARLAQVSAGYRPLFTYRNDITTVMVVQKNSKVTQLSQLRGTRIASPDRIALVTMQGIKMLRDEGLVVDKDFSFQWTATHGNVALAVQRGEVAAGLMGEIPLRQLPENSSRNLRILATSPTVTSQILMAHARLTNKQVQEVKEALIQFEASESGQNFFKSSKLYGLRTVREDELKSLDPYVKEIKRMLDLTK